MREEIPHKEYAHPDLEYEKCSGKKSPLFARTLFFVVIIKHIFTLSFTKVVAR